MRTSGKESKEKFLLAAISEMKEHGVTDFSVRRVAERCGLSSGAPYKHFADKNALILESLNYINESWLEIQRQVLERYAGNPREQITEICIAYIKFLCQHPEFQSILMINDKSMTPEQLREKATISEATTELLQKYCRDTGMPEEVKMRKIYIGRSIVYGAAVMVNAGIMTLNDDTLNTVRYCIKREFDLE